MRPFKIVIDTNVVIAAAISPTSRPATAIVSALKSGEVVVSAALRIELEAVFRRPKFDRYRSLDNRLGYLASFYNAATPISVKEVVTTCRDPKDNMVLSLALAGQADLIITGDNDLLSLNPWRGIPILTPSAYLALHQ